MRLEQDVTEDARLYYTEGLDLYKRNEILDAESAFTRALEASPGYVDAGFHRALARYRNDKLSDAFDDLIELLIKRGASKEVFLLMGRIMAEDGVSVCIEKATRTTTSIGIPNDILDLTLSSRSFDMAAQLEKLRQRL